LRQQIEGQSLDTACSRLGIASSRSKVIVRLAVWKFMLTFVPKGGLWSSTNLLSQIRLCQQSVEQGRCL